jgi:hypothetical protein
MFPEFKQFVKKLRVFKSFSLWLQSPTKGAKFRPTSLQLQSAQGRDLEPFFLEIGPKVKKKSEIRSPLLTLVMSQ